MKKNNAANDRVKHEYLAYLKQAHGRDDATISGVARSLAQFEQSTKACDFKRFHRKQAVAFKTRLGQAVNARTGERISKATMLSTLRDLRAFFLWLVREPGFKRHIKFADADYFNLSDKDVAVARAKRDKRVPTLAQVQHVLSTMPTDTVLERRDRALIAFTALTAARVGALRSFRLGHVDIGERKVEHDARTVDTKFSKTFPTFFVLFVNAALDIFSDWVRELEHDCLWSKDEPLFPATQMGLDESGGFRAAGISRGGWKQTQSINVIFRHAFEGAGLSYYNPHSFRDMLVHHAMTLNLSPEAMKAFSQNIGHNAVLTTLTSYGTVPKHRQGELIRGLEHPAANDAINDPNIIALIKAIQSKPQPALPPTGVAR